jgi:hypothetical protein
VAGELRCQAGVIEGGDYGFARAGGGHHQVAPVVVQAELGGQLFEDLLLVGVGAEVLLQGLS